MAAVAECLLKSASGERDDYRCWGCSKKQVKSQWYTHMYRMKAVLGLDPPREKFRELMAQAVVERLGDVAVPLPDDPLTADQRHPFLARLRAALTTDGRLLCDPRDRKPRKRKHAETPASADCPAPQRPFPGAAPPAAATSASAAAVGADGASSGADSGAGKQPLAPGARPPGLPRLLPRAPPPALQPAAAPQPPPAHPGPPAAVLAPARQGQARLNSTIAIAVLRSQLEEAKMRQADLRAELEDAETQIDQLSHPPVDVQRMIAQLKAELAAVKAKVAARGYPVNGSESLVDAVEPAGRPSRRRYTPPEELLHAAREDYRKCGFSLRPNRYHVAVVGPSGTGKSALVRGLAKLVCQRSGLPAAPRLPDVPGPGGVRRLTACGVPSSPLTLWDCPSPLSPNVAVYVRQQHLGAFQMQVLVVDRVIEGVHGGLLYALRKEFPTQRMAVVFAKGDSLVADMCRAEPGLTQAQAVSRLRQLALKAARQVTPGSSPLRPDDVFVLSAHSMLAVGEGVPGVQLQLEEERFVAAVLDAMIDDGEEAAESGPGRHGDESLTGLDALAAAAADLLAFGASVGQTDESNADAAGTPQDSDVEARDDPSMAANAGDGCGVRLGGLAWARPVLAELVGPALGPDGGPLGGAWFRAAVGEGPGLLLQVAPEGLRCYGPLERRNGGGGPASNGAQATQAACGSGSGDPPLLRLS
ncbi:hypothetical protein HYH03_002009 [Edaphochlamys debaryana]|uniref:Uncharacterized protein n=1 Tax=Edaphochlamys debaryana TaxID=47281 RepID=A0A836C4R3_9CHLO|nr:hypothetical protein HYH03_002009 [Edaphochlamys debaryana]|eukprot:KAG2500441.1 hypothetical protein HYH03_002009 [Edaphochlamys debaryana]